MSARRVQILLLALCAGLPGACGGERSAPTVLVVTLDTTRADRLGSYGRAAAATPVLDALAERGARFTRAYTTAPITLPAHASLFTGLVPAAHGLRDNGAGRLPAAATTLAERFADAGWRTGAFVASFPLEAGFGLDQGFERYDDAFGARAPDAPYDERPAPKVVDAAVAWLDTLPDDAPLFLWVHLFDPHRPWRAPGAHGADDAAYQAEITVADAQLGRLLAALDERGRAQDRHVLVVGDHGEGLGEHGEASHALLLHDATLRVPLLLAGPGVPAGLVVDTPVSVVDVTPTLAALRGLPPADAALQGRDLGPALAREALPARPLYAESLYPERHHGWSRLQGWIDGHWKLVVAPASSARRWQLFDLDADPGELHDLADAQPERARELARALDGFLARLPEPLAESAPLPADDEVLRRLAALGYTAPEPDPLQEGRHPQDMTDLLEHFHTGRRAAQRGDLAEAERRLAELSASEPGGLMELELRAELEAARGSLDPEALERAAALFQQGTERAPTRKGLWRRLGQVRRAQGRLLDALTALEHALTVAAPSDDLRAEHAELLDLLERAAFSAEDAGELAEALALWEQVAERRPDDRTTQSALERVRARLAEGEG